MTKFLFAAVLLGLGLGSGATYMYTSKHPAPVTGVIANASKVVGTPSTVVGMGYSKQGGDVLVFASDGRAVTPKSFNVDDKGNWEAELPDGVHVKGVAP